MAEPVDRRTRKKRRTHLAIQDAAFELFAERGYRETTIRAIADRADVAPRTVTVHFATKEELLFDTEPFRVESLAAVLNDRFWERRAQRAHIINAEPGLRGRARAGYYEFERVLAEAIGADLGQAGTALVPRLAALAAVAGLRDLYETDELRALPSPPTAAGLLTLVDRVVAFTRAGIAG